MQFTEAVVNLKFDEEPKYEAYIRLFEGLCGPRSQRPIQTLNVVQKVGTKRPRDPNDEIFLDSTGAPKKKVGIPAAEVNSMAGCPCMSAAAVSYLATLREPSAGVVRCCVHRYIQL